MLELTQQMTWYATGLTAVAFLLVVSLAAACVASLVEQQPQQGLACPREGDRYWPVYGSKRSPPSLSPGPGVDAKVAPSSPFGCTQAYASSAIRGGPASTSFQALAAVQR